MNKGLLHRFVALDGASDLLRSHRSMWSRAFA